jgi:hypothetical protein
MKRRWIEEELVEGWTMLLDELALFFVRRAKL